MAPQVPAQPSPMEVFWAAPPFSRTITALTLTISVLVYTKILSGYWVIFYTPYLLKIPPQLWRFFTCFMLTDPDLSIIFDSYFLYTYGSKLEIGSPRFARPADFYTYIIFLWVTIISLIAVDGSWKRGRSPLHFDKPAFAINPKGLVRGVSMVGMSFEKTRVIYQLLSGGRDSLHLFQGLNMVFTGAVIFTSALILALTYTACQDDRLSKVRFFVVTIPATWVPLAMLFLTFVVRGSGAAKVQATGLAAAHAHDFLSNIYPTFGGGVNVLETPEFIKRFFAIKVPQIVQRAYGTAITHPEQPRGSAGSAAKSSSSASVLPESWRSRGTGHRLGGD